jgi:hypothetical protein
MTAVVYFGLRRHAMTMVVAHPMTAMANKAANGK